MDIVAALHDGVPLQLDNPRRVKIPLPRVQDTGSMLLGSSPVGAISDMQVHDEEKGGLHLATMMEPPSSLVCLSQALCFASHQTIIVYNNWSSNMVLIGRARVRKVNAQPMLCAETIASAADARNHSIRLFTCFRSDSFMAIVRLTTY